MMRVEKYLLSLVSIDVVMIHAAQHAGIGSSNLKGSCSLFEMRAIKFSAGNHIFYKE